MSIALIGPDGRRYQLGDPAELAAAKAQGYREETAEAPRTLGEQVSGAGAGAAEALGQGALGVLHGLSGGLSGLVEGGKPDPTADLSQLSPETQGITGDPGSGSPLSVELDAREIARKRADHPIARGAGELAGMVLSPINKLASPIEGAIGATSVLGRIAAKGVSNAAVGTLFGAGNTLSDSVLGDHDLTAEKLIAGGGLGAVLGGAGGLFGGALEEGVAALPKLARAVTGADTTLGDWAGSRALKAAGATKRDLDYLGEDKAKAVGKVLLERGHLGQGTETPNARGVLESIQADKEKVGTEIGGAVKAVDATGAKPDYQRVLERLDEWNAKLSPLQQEAIAPELEATKRAAMKSGGLGTVEGITKPLQVSEPEGFAALNGLKRDLQAKAKWGDNVGQEFKGGLKRQLAGIVRDEFDTQIVPQLGADAGKAFIENKTLLGHLLDAERIAEHGVERLGGNASFGLRDTMIGAGLLGHGNPVLGVVSAIASKLMRERGQAVVARLAHEISKSPSLSPIAASFAQKLQGAAPALGRYIEPLTQAAAQSPAHALATHLTLAKVDPHYAAAAQLAGFSPESPEQQSFALGKAHHLATIAAQLEAHNAELERGVDQVLKGSRAPVSSAALKSQDFGSKRMRRESADGHQQRVKEVRALAADPGALLDRITANLGPTADVAPGVAASVTKTAHAAVQYLAQQAQTPAKAGPLAQEWVPTQAERYHFSQSLEAVQDPMSVLRHAAAGTLTNNHVEALKAVYPLLARQIADKAIERIAAAPKSVPYKSRLMLFVLTGVDVDGTFNPLAVARNQAAVHATNSQEQQTGAPQPPGERKSELTLASRMALPNQRAEIADGEA